MIPIGTEITEATAVITRVPTIACEAPPAPPIAPRASSVKNSTLRPGMPRLATSKTSEKSGTIASTKAAAISTTIVVLTARRRQPRPPESSREVWLWPRRGACAELSIVLFVVLAGDDHPRAHVGDEGDCEEDEPGRDQRV